MKDVSQSLDQLKNDVQAEDSADTFMEPGKKRRGRPKGSKNQKTSDAQRVNPVGGSAELPPTPDVEQTKKLVRPAVEAISFMGVKIAEDPAAAMQPTELEIIVETSALCINQYLPGVLGTHANAIVLSVTLAQWSLRVWLLRQAKLEELKQKANQMKDVGGNVA